MIKSHSLGMNYIIEKKQLKVLDSINFGIADVKTVAIVGPSGSGKTTLLILPAGLEQPQSGEMKLGGKMLNPIDADALADLRRDSLGIIFQSFHLVQSLTALANVALPLEIAGKLNAREHAREMLDKAGLIQRQNHYQRSYREASSSA
jgi:putative ABC transport system ATP-binding protein